MPKKQVAVSLRKPPQPANIDAFVAGEASAPAPAPASARAPKATITSPDPVVKHGAREYREMTLYLPAEVARELSFFCIDHKRDVNTVVAEAVTELVTPSSKPAQAESAQVLPEPARFSAPALLRQFASRLWRARSRVA